MQTTGKTRKPRWPGATPSERLRDAAHQARIDKAIAEMEQGLLQPFPQDLPDHGDELAGNGSAHRPSRMDRAIARRAVGAAGHAAMIILAGYGLGQIVLRFVETMQ